MGERGGGGRGSVMERDGEELEVGERRKEGKEVGSRGEGG